MHRNEQFQEDMWRRSFEFLKDHLSAETKEKYGPPLDQTSGPAMDSEEVKGREATVPEKEGDPGKF